MSKTYKPDGFNYQKKFKPNVKRSSKNVTTVKKKVDLYSPGWEEIRRMVYRRDGHRCVYCGCKGKLHAHHIVPVRISKDNSLNNLVSVCDKCHRKLEAVGFMILENGGSSVDVKRTELRMIAEAKQKRLEKYKQKLEEEKILKESENGRSCGEIRENRETASAIIKSSDENSRRNEENEREFRLSC